MWRGREASAAGFLRVHTFLPAQGRGGSWEDRASLMDQVSPGENHTQKCPLPGCTDHPRHLRLAGGGEPLTLQGPAEFLSPLSLQFLTSCACPCDCRRHTWPFLLPPSLVAQKMF